MLQVWREANIYENRLLDGWEAALKVDRQVFYSFHIRDPEFQPVPVSAIETKVADKMKLIVVPELKTYYKRLLDNKDKLTIECKLSGVP